jgi:hypothetical protein
MRYQHVKQHVVTAKRTEHELCTLADSELGLLLKVGVKEADGELQPARRITIEELKGRWMLIHSSYAPDDGRGVHVHTYPARVLLLPLLPPDVSMNMVTALVPSITECW